MDSICKESEGDTTVGASKNTYIPNKTSPTIQSKLDTYCGPIVSTSCISPTSYDTEVENNCVG